MKFKGAMQTTWERMIWAEEAAVANITQQDYTYYTSEDIAWDFWRGSQGQDRVGP